MANFDPKNELVRNRALKVQTLKIPFTITGSATSGNVVSVSDEPSLLFIQTQGYDQITAEVAIIGCTAPSFASKTDSSGNFSVLVYVGEQVAKVMDARILKRDANGSSVCSIANTSGKVSTGDAIVLNALTGVDLTAGNLNACLEVSYSV